MSKTRNFLAASILALSTAVAFAQSATPSETPRDLTVEQTAAHAAGVQRPGSLQLQTWVDRADATYATGEQVRLYVQTNEDAFVTVLNVGPTGTVTQLFPNGFQADGRVRPGQPVEIPAPQSGATIRVAGPTGAELIKVIASNRPLTVIPTAQLVSRGLFSTVEGGVDTFARNLELAASQVPADQRIAIENRVIRTIAVRPQASLPVVGSGGIPAVGPVAPAPIGVVVPSPSSGPTMLPLPQTANAFPLLLALDKPSYRVGERVVMAVTPFQTCHLTVFNVNAVGAVRILFPNQIVTNNRIEAMQTTLIAGANAPVSIVATPPTGLEQVVAVCTTDPRPVLSTAPAPATPFAILPARDVVERDLVAVAARPPGSVAVNAVTLSITQ